MIGTSAIGFLAAMTTFFSKIDHELEYGNSFLLWYFFSVRDTFMSLVDQTFKALRRAGFQEAN